MFVDPTKKIIITTDIPDMKNVSPYILLDKWSRDHYQEAVTKCDPREKEVQLSCGKMGLGQDLSGNIFARRRTRTYCDVWDPFATAQNSHVNPKANSHVTKRECMFDSFFQFAWMHRFQSEASNVVILQSKSHMKQH